MRNQRILAGLTALNLMLLGGILAMQVRRVDAAQQPDTILRGSGLEIVDAQGRVRASITINPTTTVGGLRYPETVLLRLTDPQNGPVVKLTASANGSALGLSDDRLGGVQLFARDTASFVRVVGRDGRQEMRFPGPP